MNLAQLFSLKVYQICRFVDIFIENNVTINNVDFYISKGFRSSL